LRLELRHTVVCVDPRGNRESEPADKTTMTAGTTADDLELLLRAGRCATPSAAMQDF